MFLKQHHESCLILFSSRCSLTCFVNFSLYCDAQMTETQPVISWMISSLPPSGRHANAFVYAAKATFRANAAAEIKTESWRSRCS